MKDDKLRDAFLEDIKIRSWSNWTIKSCMITLRMFLDFINKDCTLVDISDLKNFLVFLKKRPGYHGRKGLSPETIRKHINNLASFYEFLEFEDHIARSLVPKFRRRYMRSYIRSSQNNARERQLITVKEMRDLISTALNPRDKAIITLLAKTGVRVSELVGIDLDDINWSDHSTKLKPNGKRSNLRVFFDEECARILDRWCRIRQEMTKKKDKALFITENLERIGIASVNKIVKKYATRIGLHNDKAEDLEKRFTPHCCRHWFTTHLLRSGMPREYVKELRGDSRNETIDIYHHIDEKELRESYLAHMPELGI